MPLDFEENIGRAFGRIYFPFPQDWPPIKVGREHAVQPWKNFGNKGSVLVEEAFFLYALVRMIKPRFVLDCGTWMGMSAAFMAQALRDNGFGRIVTVEHHENAIAIARHFLGESGYGEVAIFPGKVENYVPNEPIDFLFLDTEVHDRLKQFDQLKSHFAERCWVAFHDAGAISGLRDLPYPYLHFGTIREMRIFCVNRSGKEEKTGIFAPVQCQTRIEG